MTPTKYKVKPGDTLSEIARHHHVTVDDIAHINGIKDVDRIRVGQSLRIPVKSDPTAPSAPMAPPPARTLPPLPSSVRPRTHRVRPAETLPQIAQRYGLSVSELAKANGLVDPRLLWIGQELNIPPEHPSSRSAQPPAQSNNEASHTGNPAPPHKQSPPTASPPSSQSIKEVAFAVTSAFEGGKASTYQNIDDGGIVSYGKHQATLASGTLEAIITQYVERSRTPAAKGLARYKDKISRKDPVLGKDEAFKKLLLEAAADPLMSTIQDEVFGKMYWSAAEKFAKEDKLKTPLALILYYDTHIHGGLADVRASTAKELRGKNYTEGEFLAEFNRQRDLRLAGLVASALKKDQKEKANARQNSRKRVAKLQELVDAKNFQLRGDRNGILFIHDGRKVYGLDAVPASTGKQLALAGSVGKGGHNAAADVWLVQHLINANRPLLYAQLPANGRVDSQLLDAIIQFQGSIGMKNPDGRVDPDGATLKALCANARNIPGQRMPWELPLPSGTGTSNPAPSPAPSTTGNATALAKLANATNNQSKKQKNEKNKKKKTRRESHNQGYCATDVSEMLHEAGYSFNNARPRVIHGLINDQAYDYSTGTWVSGSTRGYYVKNRSNCLDKQGRVLPGRQSFAFAYESAKFFAHTLRMLGFADGTKLLPGNGWGGTAPAESVKALRTLPEGAVIVFGPALNRSVQLTGGNYAVGGRGHAGHVGILVYEGQKALVVADGMRLSDGTLCTVEMCLSMYEWAIGFVPTTAPRALTSKDLPKSSLLGPA
ncbi:LysM peptidoglycan-binding domain-containing protein [Cystobacter fuscus]|uniref:LysM peptidoglycan-binding domain-containing protein n=1 Tax=Cystobacter fuscus TaxID=43 RepID=UPI002B2EEFCB|nr:LysM peptidoglycan-binding domain-containing protein [Cystobacter fuscus]